MMHIGEKRENWIREKTDVKDEREIKVKAHETEWKRAREGVREE